MKTQLLWGGAQSTYGGGGEGGRPPLDNWGMPPALEKLGTQEESAGTF